MVRVRVWRRGFSGNGTGETDEGGEDELENGLQILVHNLQQISFLVLDKSQDTLIFLDYFGYGRKYL